MKLSKSKITKFGVELAPTRMDRVRCFFGNHVLVVEKQLSHQCQKVRCIKCQREFAINHSCNIILEWDEQVEDFYKVNGDLFKP